MPEKKFAKMLVDNLYHSLGQSVHSATKHDVFTALSLTVRDHLIERWRKITDARYEAALTVGTLDGANVEIRDLVGKENFFLFGLTVDEVFRLKESGYRPREYYEADAELKDVITSIADGDFAEGDCELFKPIVDSLLECDDYMLLADFRSYVECSERAAQAYKDPENWTKMSILNAARCGFFSSDRTIREYCDDIWGMKPVKLK